MKKTLAILLVTALCLTSFHTTDVLAARPKLNKTKATIYAGKSVQLKVKYNRKKIKWVSSNKRIATISSKGLVKGKKAGKVVITAKIGSKKYKCKITVKKKPVKKPIVTTKPTVKPTIKGTEEVITKVILTIHPGDQQYTNPTDNKPTQTFTKPNTETTTVEELPTTYNNETTTIEELPTTYHKETTTVEELPTTYNNETTTVEELPTIDQGNQTTAETTTQENYTTEDVTTFVGDPIYSEEWEVGRDENGKLWIFAYKGTDTQIVIPNKINGESVYGIGERSFYADEDLQEVTISSGIKEIGDSAFEECINLRTVNMPSTIIAIGDSAFSGCVNIYRSVS